ncbi:MAG: FAD-binding oxidoreductase, partial [Pseudomonadota bacterium]
MNLLFANDRAGEYPPSWYAASTEPLAPFAQLKGDATADVVVIGAGFTGLSAALDLAEAGYDVALLEAQRVGWGASGRNGGQVGTGQRNDMEDIERSASAADAKLLWQMTLDAKTRIKDQIERHEIDAHWRSGVAYVTWKPGEVAGYHKNGEHLAQRYGYDRIRPLDKAAADALVPSGVFAGGFLDEGAGHLHPLAFALGLARACAAAGVRIFEGSPVTRFNPGDPATATTAGGRVTARYAILACNGYLGGLHDGVAARVMPINNFIVATEPLGQAGAEALITRDVAVADSKFVVNYWRRSHDHRLVFGGGETYGYRFPADIAALVRPAMLSIYPDLHDVRIDYAWGGTLAITVSRMPYVRRLAPNVLTASGYSGHGVGLANQAGALMARAIQGTSEGFEALTRLKTLPFPGGRALRSSS